MRHTRLYRDGVLEAKDFPAAQISDYLGEPGTVVWLDLCEPDRADLEVVSQEFGLHPLAVEDAIQQHERPKLDRYQDHAFLTAYAVSLDPATGRLTTSELAAFATPRALITVRKDLGFDIDGVVGRWDGSADLAGHGVGFLLWGLLDLVVDGHFGRLVLGAAAQPSEEAMNPTVVARISGNSRRWPATTLTTPGHTRSWAGRYEGREAQPARSCPPSSSQRSISLAVSPSSSDRSTSRRSATSASVASVRSSGTCSVMLSPAHDVRPCALPCYCGPRRWGNVRTPQTESSARR
jgi:hypothetical protein